MSVVKIFHADQICVNIHVHTYAHTFACIINCTIHLVSQLYSELMYFTLRVINNLFDDEND